MKRAPALAAMLAAVMWGSTGFFVRYLTVLGFDSYNLIILRAACTSMLLLLYLALFDREKLKIRWKDLWFFVLSALVNVIFFNFCLMQSMQRNTLSLASVLLYSAPVFVMLFSCILFEEKLTPAKLAALLLTFAGCALVSGLATAGIQADTVGLLLGLGSGLAYGSYSVFSKYALRRYHPLTFTAYNFTIAAALSFPFCRGGIAGVFGAHPGAWLMVVVFALCANLIPYCLYTYSLKYMDAGKASICTTVEPVTASLLGALVFGEALGGWTVVGILLVVGGAMVLNLKRKERE